MSRSLEHHVFARHLHAPAGDPASPGRRESFVRQRVSPVVAYPPPKGLQLRPAKFFSREQLVERLRAALPGFDENLLGTALDTQIVFAGDVQLNKAQLVALGVAR